MVVQSKQIDEWIAVCANAGMEKQWFSLKFDAVLLKSLPQTSVYPHAHRLLLLRAS